MRQHRILYVDDDADMRDIAVLSLSREGAFDVRACASGRQALSIIPDWTPDLMLLDVVMPEWDGPATLAHLRDSPTGRKLPVVFITARSAPAEAERLRALGAVGLIAKPFNPMTLAAEIKTYLPRDDS